MSVDEDTVLKTLVCQVLIIFLDSSKDISELIGTFDDGISWIIKKALLLCRSQHINAVFYQVNISSGY